MAYGDGARFRQIVPVSRKLTQKFLGSRHLLNVEVEALFVVILIVRLIIEFCFFGDKPNLSQRVENYPQFRLSEFRAKWAYFWWTKIFFVKLSDNFLPIWND